MVKINTSFTFQNEIKFKNVFFKYSASSQYILNDINFNIKKNEVIGIIGETGSGKSTLVNLIIGLIKNTSGKIDIDKAVKAAQKAFDSSWANLHPRDRAKYLRNIGKELRENAKSWTTKAKETLDANNDGKIDLEEIYSYVARRFASRNNRPRK